MICPRIHGHGHAGDLLTLATLRKREVPTESQDSSTCGMTPQTDSMNPAQHSFSTLAIQFLLAAS